MNDDPWTQDLRTIGDTIHVHCALTPIRNRKNRSLERQVWDLLRQAEMSRLAYERVALSMKELNVSLSMSA